MKPQYRTEYVVHGGRTYAIDCRVTPPRAGNREGPDSPRYLDPGYPPRVQVLRILLDRIDVGGDLLFFTRASIEDQAKTQALAWMSRILQIRRAVRFGSRSRACCGGTP